MFIPFPLDLSDSRRPYYMPRRAPSPYNPAIKDADRPLDLLEPLQATVHRMTGIRVMEASYLGCGFHNVAYLLRMESGPPLVAKIVYNHKNDAESLEWFKNTLRCETAVHTLLTRCQPSVPVARIFAVDLGPEFSIGEPFMLMEKMEGEDQWRAWMTMNLHQKETFVASLAETMANIFMITMPAIGSVDGIQENGQVTVGHFVNEPGWDTIGPFFSITEFIDAQLLFYSQRCYDGFEPPRVAAIFAELTSLTHELLKKIMADEAMLRPVLVHYDYNNRNILVKDSKVSGILDWQRHVTLPACLGVDYPESIRFDGIFDPKYGLHKRTMPTKLSWSPADECEHLKKLYQKAAMEFCPEYGRALIVGQTLRQILEFLWSGSLGPTSMWLADITKS